jgi:hypothetical protein
MKYEDFVEQLKGLDFEDLLDLYLYAKTGKANVTDLLPLDPLLTIAEEIKRLIE